MPGPQGAPAQRAARRGRRKNSTSPSPRITPTRRWPASWCTSTSTCTRSTRELPEPMMNSPNHHPGGGLAALTTGHQPAPTAFFNSDLSGMATPPFSSRLRGRIRAKSDHRLVMDARATGIMSEQHLVRLVLQDDGQMRMSSRSFAYANWFTNGIKVCGRPSERTEKVWQQVFNTSVKREETLHFVYRKLVTID